MQSLERMQALLELGSFEFHLIFLEEATIDGKIVLVPEQQGGGFFAVASRATGLLRIVVQADKRRMVDNKPDCQSARTSSQLSGREVAGRPRCLPLLFAASMPSRCR